MYILERGKHGTSGVKNKRTASLADGSNSELNCTKICNVNQIGAPAPGIKRIKAETTHRRVSTGEFQDKGVTGVILSTVKVKHV